MNEESVNCVMSSCYGFICCVNTPILSTSVQISWEIQECRNRINLQIEKMKKTIKLDNFNFGKKSHFCKSCRCNIEIFLSFFMCYIAALYIYSLVEIEKNFEKTISLQHQHKKQTFRQCRLYYICCIFYACYVWLDIELNFLALEQSLYILQYFEY